ncbi:MAG: outer membrane beta-barrel protein [Flavobacteriales bacterium]|nr:outer membrane beta-barrel protein [Flavobacteriales bacterium]HPF89633.1 outer membrane beta-barrel protein [Flavobacteriales bacterium]
MITRTYLLPIGLALCTAVLGQDKGFISGTLSFDSHTFDNAGELNDRTITSGTFGPAVGYNLSNVHVVGLALTFTGTRTTYKDLAGNAVIEVSEERSMMTIAPFYRYMKSVNEKFLLYGQFKAGIGFGKETVEAGPFDSEAKLGSMDIHVGPGLVYIPADRWALSADWGLLGYHHDKRTEEGLTGDVVTNSSGFQASLNPGYITLALNWLF